MSEKLPSGAELHAEATSTIEALAARITAFTESQTPLWRRLPRLALLAQGRTDFYRENAKIYHWGKAPINSTAIGLFGLHLDCASGVLGNYSGDYPPPSSPKPMELVDTFLRSPNSLNAQSWTERFTQQAEVPVSAIYQPGGQSEDIRVDWLAHQAVLLELIPEEFTPDDAVRLKAYVDILPVDYD